MIHNLVSTKNPRHFPNVYLLRLVSLLNGVGRDWIALEVPERAGGAGVCSFHNSYLSLVPFLVFILLTFLLLDPLVLFPLTLIGVKFFLNYMFDLTMLYTYIHISVTIYMPIIHLFVRITASC